MFKEHFIYFIKAKTYAGPFQTFEAAFSHATRHQKDCRIELANETVLATWSTWTGLYKVGVKYQYKIVDCEFNRTNFPDLVGQTVDVAPSFAMVKEVEAA